MGTLNKDTANRKLVGNFTQSDREKKYTLLTADKYVDSNIEINVVVGHENLVADNIKQDVNLFGITGTLDYIKTVEEVPAEKETSIIYNSTNNTFYLWKEE